MERKYPTKNFRKKQLLIEQMIYYLFASINQHKGVIAVSLLALIAEIIVVILEPWSFKFIFDEIIFKEFQFENLQLPFLNNLQVSFLDNLNIISLLFLSLIALVIIVLLRTIAAYSNTRTMTLAAIRVMNEIRANLYFHIQNLSFAPDKQLNTEKSIASVIHDIKRLRKVILFIVLPLLTKILTTIAMLAVMMWLNFQLAMMGIVIFLLFLITKERQKSLKVSQQTQNLTEIQNHVVKILVAVSIALIIWRGVGLVNEGAVTPGDLLVLLTYLKVTFKPMGQWQTYREKIADGIASCKRITSFLEIAPKVGAS